MMQFTLRFHCLNDFFTTVDKLLPGLILTLDLNGIKYQWGILSRGVYAGGKQMDSVSKWIRINNFGSVCLFLTNQLHW